MFVHAHAGIGWALAELGRGSRQFRRAVFLSAILPDLDGLSVFFGLSAYGAIHHKYTHTLLFSLLVSAVAGAYCRQERRKTLVFTQIGFYLHYFGDYFFTEWPSLFFYPFSQSEFIYPRSACLWDPVNQVFNVLSVLTLLALGWWLKRTPFEVISPALDRRVVNLLFRKRDLTCHVCGTRTNERCESCSKPVCTRHAPLNWRFAVECTVCEAGKRSRGRTSSG